MENKLDRLIKTSLEKTANQTPMSENGNSRIRATITARVPGAFDKPDNINDTKQPKNRGNEPWI